MNTDGVSGAPITPASRSIFEGCAGREIVWRPPGATTAYSAGKTGAEEVWLERFANTAALASTLGYGLGLAGCWVELTGVNRQALNTSTP